MTTDVANPYLVCVSDFDAAQYRTMDEAIEHALLKAGFDTGPGLTLTLQSFSLSREKRRKAWQRALDRAGIERMETGRDEEKRRIWLRVWRKEPKP